MLISAFAGGIGLFLGWLAVKQGDPTNGALPVFHLPPRQIVMGVVFALLLGLVSGVLPALQAMRLNAVEALRRE